MRRRPTVNREAGEAREDREARNQSFFATFASLATFAIDRRLSYGWRLNRNVTGFDRVRR